MSVRVLHYDLKSHSIRKEIKMKERRNRYEQKQKSMKKSQPIPDRVRIPLIASVHNDIPLLFSL